MESPATSDVSDAQPEDAAVCELELRQYGGLRAFSGAIETVRCPEDNVLVREQLEAPGEGRVLVVDGAGSLRVALLGDQLAVLGLEHGWTGVVVNGAIRDVARLRELPFGVAALGSCPRRSRKEGRGETGVPVSFGNVEFRPGGTIYADEDGVVALPAP